MTAPDLSKYREELALALFAAEQCDRRQAQDVPGNWHGRLSESDQQEYLDLADALLPVLARVVAEAKAEAWERGFDDGQDRSKAYHPNPYRAEASGRDGEL